MGLSVPPPGSSSLCTQCPTGSKEAGWSLLGCQTAGAQLGWLRVFTGFWMGHYGGKPAEVHAGPES